MATISQPLLTCRQLIDLLAELDADELEALISSVRLHRARQALRAILDPQLR
jgi:hypothetical protein